MTSQPPGRQAKTYPLPTGPAKQRIVREMFDTIAGRYDLLNAVMSLGLDGTWRRRCLEHLDLPRGSTVLDVACGTGDLWHGLERRGMQAVGLDLSVGMLSHAHNATRLVLGDALASPLRPGSFDGAVSGFALRNVVDLGALFDELARVLRPGGRISLLDLGEPEQLLVRLGHRLWSNHIVPRLGALFSNASAYEYLPHSLAYLPPAGEMARLLSKAGFTGTEHVPLSGGISQLYVATRARATRAL